MSSDAVLLDMKHVAQMFGLHEATVYKLLSCSKFPRPIKLGRANRWLKSELTDWMQAKCPALEQWEAMRRNTR